MGGSGRPRARILAVERPPRLAGVVGGGGRPSVLVLLLRAAAPAWWCCSSGRPPESAIDVRKGGRPSVLVLWVGSAALACWCFCVSRTLPQLWVTAGAIPKPCFSRMARRRCASTSVAWGMAGEERGASQ